MNGLQRALVVTKNDFREEQDGGSKRTAAVVRALEASGFQVDWIAANPLLVSDRLRSTTPARNWLRAATVYANIIRSMSAAVAKWYSPRLISTVLSATSANAYDVVVIDHSHLALLRHLVTTRLLCMNMHNIESELMSNYASSATGWRRFAAQHEARRLRAVEGGFTDSFDVVAVVSDHDKAIAGFDGAPNVVVATNGVEESFFLAAESARTLDVVFVGHLGWRPNIDAANWLAREVWPLVREQWADARLSVVGKNPGPSVLALAGNGIRIEPNVATVVPYVSSAKVATAPLLSAGGTRIKILEALASGTPVIATPLGALGLEHLEGNALSIRESPESFAAAIVKTARDSVDRAAVRDCVRGYAWSTSMEPFLLRIQEALSRPH